MQEGELKMFHDIRGLTFMAVLSEKIKDYKKQIGYMYDIIKLLQKDPNTNKLHPS